MDTTSFIFKDYYSILGIPRSATLEQIKSAFRKKAKETHPDVAADPTEGREKFLLVREAYEVLTDENKKREYDSLWDDLNVEAKISTDEDLHNIYEAFKDDLGNVYSDEWEFFVRDPEEYLSWIEKSKHALISTAFTMVLTFLSTALVTLATVLSVMMIWSVISSAVTAAAVASIGSIIGFLYYLFSLGYWLKMIKEYKEKLIAKFSNLIVKSVRGLSKGGCIVLLKSTFYASTLALLYLYYKAIEWIYSQSGAASDSNAFPIIVCFLFIILTGPIVLMSLNLTSQVIDRSISRYSEPFYRKVKLVRRDFIDFKPKKLLNPS